jgi:hypothetical protein
MANRTWKVLTLLNSAITERAFWSSVRSYGEYGLSLPIPYDEATLILDDQVTGFDSMKLAKALGAR